MIAIRSAKEIETIAECGRIVAGALARAAEMVAPGVSTRELEGEIEAYILSQDARPSFKGYRGYPASACISVNDVVVHGIPSGRRLQAGDIVSIDVGAYKGGYHGDGAWTFPVGEIEEEKVRLLRVTHEALMAGVAQARPGEKLGRVSNAIQKFVEENGFSVVRALVGHGVGAQLHEEPQVPNFGSPRQGPTLQAGMVLAIEPMVNAGSFQVYTEDDGWTVVSRDHSASAHFEHTVAITADGPRILTVPSPALAVEGRWQR